MTHRTLPKALSLALALAVASFGTLLAPSAALAESPKPHAGETQAPAKGAAPAEGKAKPQRATKTKTKKAPGTKARASAKPPAKPDKATSKPAKAKRSASRENKPAPKRAKPQPKADDSPRPGDTRVDAGVITRLDAIARKLPGRTFSIVSGPSSTAGGSSAHHAGRAVDLRVDGVDNEKLIEVCRSLPDTGCGYYPKASFVHLDVRAQGSGKSFWIDASEPGEPPRYVTSWPPPQPAPKPAAPAK